MSEYFTRLEERLAALRISANDARDGLLESYVVANRKAIEAGLADLALEASDDVVYKKLYEVMSELLAERGGDIGAPTVRDLRSVRHTMDLKLRHIELPPEISQMHEIACETILEKAVDGEAGTSAPAKEPVELDEFEKLKRELSDEMGAAIREVEAEPVQTREMPSPSPFKFTPKAPEPEPRIEMPAYEAEPETAGEVSLDDLFVKTLEQRLDSETLSPAEARDGIIEAYVVANRNAVRLGDVGLAPEASDAEIEYRVRNMMREYFRERNASFEEPDIEVLDEAKKYLDEAWDIPRMPEGVRSKHDELCNALLLKAQSLQAMVEGKKPVLSVGSFRPSAVIKPEMEFVPPLEAPEVEPVVETVEAVEPVEPPRVEAPVETLPQAQVPVEELQVVEEQVSEIAEVPEAEPVEEPQPEPVVPEPQVQEEEIREPLPAAKPLLEAKTELSLEELLARVKADLREIVRAEVEAALAKPSETGLVLKPPSGVSGEVVNKTIFLAWLDVRGQPGYHVYRREGAQWVRLTSTPLTRPSFSMKVETRGEIILAVTSVSSKGEESDLSTEVRVTV